VLIPPWSAKDSGDFLSYRILVPPEEVNSSCHADCAMLGLSRIEIMPLGEYVKHKLGEFDMNNNPTEIFRERLRQAREANNLTQAELAEKSGLPSSSISHFENGPRKPSFDNLRRLAAALNVTTDYLLGRTEDTSGQSQASILFRKAAQLGEGEMKVITQMIDMLAKK
jgi:transcriptional regulator with XRE-family HTH domain